MGKVREFKDLVIWQRGIEIVKTVYLVTENFPMTRVFGLVSQMRRASISIPSNIAEGHIKQQNKEYGRFLNISIGSCAELETQAYLHVNSVSSIPVNIMN